MSELERDILLEEFIKGLVEKLSHEISWAMIVNPAPIDPPWVSEVRALVNGLSDHDQMLIRKALALAERSGAFNVLGAIDGSYLVFEDDYDLQLIASRGGEQIDLGAGIDLHDEFIAGLGGSIFADSTRD